MSTITRKLTIIRKSIDLLKSFPRFIKRINSNSSDFLDHPSVLANSFPKSGTHLLLQIITALPNVRYYGSFIASMPSFTFRERSLKRHLRLIRKIVPGEALPAHLFYHRYYKQVLDEINCAHYFIYRDPRDVIVSEVHYLVEMNRWHRMHKYFKAIDTWDERISRAITGFNQPDFPYDYPNVAERFSRYRGWLEKPDVFSIRYENLISPPCRKYLREMADFYLDRCEDIDCNIDDLVARMEANIDPEASHTYRKGGSGGWRDVFSDRHKTQMKKVAGDLLIELGYEQDLEW